MFAELRADEHVAITNAYDWGGVRVVVDVGGGNGSLLATILERHRPKPKKSVVTLPPVPKLESSVPSVL